MKPETGHTETPKVFHLWNGIEWADWVKLSDYAVLQQANERMRKALETITQDYRFNARIIDSDPPCWCHSDHDDHSAICNHRAEIYIAAKAALTEAGGKTE